MGPRWIATAVALSIAYSCGCSTAPESFSIRSPGGGKNLEIHYFLTGAFGGYGGFVRDAEGDGACRIPLGVDRRTERISARGTPAETLKAILYAPGCQFYLLSVDLRTSSSRTATFECNPLPTVSIKGALSQFPSDRGALDVEIFYLALWGFEFFGYVDGPIQEFKVGAAPLQADGRFQIAIPDFSRDAITTQKQSAYLRVNVLAHPTGNWVQDVLPPPDLRDRNLGMKILPRYDGEILFSPR
jgi:hypothetical protein